MNFNIIIGNPPYQEMTGGGQCGASSIYHTFVNKALEMNTEYISMVIPSRWMYGGRSDMDSFRKHMIDSKHIEKIYQFDRSLDIFESVEISGGIMYFLYNATNRYKETKFICKLSNGSTIESSKEIDKYSYISSSGEIVPIIISDGMADGIIDKVAGVNKGFMCSNISCVNPFGISREPIGSNEKTDHYTIKALYSFGVEVYINENSIEKNCDLINKYKVITNRTNPDRGGVNNSRYYNVIGKPTVLKPGEVCGSTYIIIGSTDTEDEAKNLQHLMKTKFMRFLIYVTIAGIGMGYRNYIFCPVLELDHKWSDTELYNKYGLTQREIEYIESIIKEM